MEFPWETHVEFIWAKAMENSWVTFHEVAMENSWNKFVVPC